MEPAQFYLIRGLCREKGHWGGFIDKLKHKSFVREVIPLDLPGTGSFHHLTSPLKIYEYADFLLSQIDVDENNKTPKVILSISLGSMVAVEMAKKRKNFFHKIYLMNTSFSGLSPFYHRLRWRSFWDFFSIAVISDIRKKELKILKLVSNKPSVWPSLIDFFTEIARKRPCKTSNTLRQLWAASNYFADQKAPQESSFVILGSNGDRMVDSRCSRAISKHWKLPIHVHPWAGHDIAIDDPQWIFDILTKTL